MKIELRLQYLDSIDPEVKHPDVNSLGPQKFGSTGMFPNVALHFIRVYLK